MKKLFALMLALCLLGSVAMADELVWNDEAEAAAAQFEGEFYTFTEIDAKIWIPGDLEEVELNDDDAEAGIIGYFANEDGDNSITIQYYNADGMTLEEFEAELREDGDVDADSIEAGTVNGLDCMSFKYEDCGVLAFATQKGYILEVVAEPMSDEEFMQEAAFVFASIQAN